MGGREEGPSRGECVRTHLGPVAQETSLCHLREGPAASLGWGIPPSPRAALENLADTAFLPSQSKRKGGSVPSARNPGTKPSVAGPPHDPTGTLSQHRFFYPFYRWED